MILVDAGRLLALLVSYSVVLYGGSRVDIIVATIGSLSNHVYADPASTAAKGEKAKAGAEPNR